MSEEKKNSIDIDLDGYGCLGCIGCLSFIIIAVLLAAVLIIK